LRQLRGVDHEVWISTPATGRLRFDDYLAKWLPNNAARHRIPQSADVLHPTVVIDELAPKDAGFYSIECILSSSLHPWLNTTFRYTTELVIHGFSASPRTANFTTSAANYLVTSDVDLVSEGTTSARTALDGDHSSPKFELPVYAWVLIFIFGVILVYAIYRARNGDGSASSRDSSSQSSAPSAGGAPNANDIPRVAVSGTNPVNHRTRTREEIPALNLTAENGDGSASSRDSSSQSSAPSAGGARNANENSHRYAEVS